MAKLRSDGRRRNTPLTAKQIEDLQRAFRDGETLRSAADNARCSPGTVHTWFKKFREARTTQDARRQPR
jgi:hypothetical protein